MESTVVLEREQATALNKGDDRGGKYLVFQLGREEFGIRVLKVREIMGIQDITAVPQTPAHVKGVINLRGKVIPVVDLRLKFGLPEQEYTQRTCIIVVQVQRRGGAHVDGHRGGRRGRGAQPGGGRHRGHAGLRRWNGHALSVGHGQGEGQSENPAGDRPGVDQPGSARAERAGAVKVKTFRKLQRRKELK